MCVCVWLEFGTGVCLVFNVNVILDSMRRLRKEKGQPDSREDERREETRRDKLMGRKQEPKGPVRLCTYTDYIGRRLAFDRSIWSGNGVAIHFCSPPPHNL